MNICYFNTWGVRIKLVDDDTMVFVPINIYLNEIVNYGEIELSLLKFIKLTEKYPYSDLYFIDKDFGVDIKSINNNQIIATNLEITKN